MSSVGVIFGSRSVEHEVSVITAHQAIAALSQAHSAVPIYIAKDGRWYTGNALTDLRRFTDADALLAECTAVTPLIDPSRPGLALLPVGGPRRGLFGRGGDAVEIDLAMPLVHGSFGEDGTLQGLLEMAAIPYTGSGVAASAVAMDKRLAKTVLRGAGLPVLDDVLIEREIWRARVGDAVRNVHALTPYPVFVKPVSLGSSIGVARAADEAELRDAVDVALTYDGRCIVEAAQEEIIEVNCAVLGDQAGARASLLEQPTKRGPLSYDDKYRAGTGKAGAAEQAGGMKSAQRIVPAPLDEALAARIRDAALASFAAVGAAGVARVDFMVDTAHDTFVVNELNPVPGSLAFYLFEPDGLTFTALLDELIAIAQRRHARQLDSTVVFEHWMLGGGGAKTSR
jgi:D-alanine-D-alanine ligase